MPHPTPTDSTESNTHKLPWSPFAAIAIVLGIYFGSMIIGQTIFSIYPTLQGWSESHTNDWLSGSAAVQFGYVLTVETVTLLLLYFVLRYRKVAFRRLGLLRPRLHDLGIVLIAYPPYFVLNAVATVVATALFHLDQTQQQQTGFESTNSLSDLVLTFFSLVILPPIVEEIIMRGYLFGSLKSGMSVVRAALLTSVIFAVAHLQFGSGAPLLWVAAIDTFILSLVLCYVRQKTGSLWPGIGLHALKNFLAFFVLFLLPYIHGTL